MDAEPYWRAGAPDRRVGRARRIDVVRDRRRLRVGLVNNMPDAALAATERQFRSLLEAAMPERSVELQLFHVPAIARGPEALSRLRDLYRPAAEVETAKLDALIVTGAEPRAADLRDEPFWADLARLADWVEEAGTATLWSCLAAHAAVLHLDGIVRRPLARKCSGVFACRPARPDPLLEGMGRAWLTPHSRSNALDEADLAARGYRILTRSPEAGVDAFMGPAGTGRSLFLQGHPEYDEASLALEFKRDLQRYVQGLRATAPSLPRGVFDAATAMRLGALLEMARVDRSADVMTRWPLASDIRLEPSSWRAPAVRLLRNWLAYPHAATGDRVRPEVERRLGA